MSALRGFTSSANLSALSHIVLFVVKCRQRLTPMGSSLPAHSLILYTP